MKGKKLAAKIMLGLLLATPYGIAEANSIGTVTVDGVQQEVNAAKDFFVGDEKSVEVKIEASGPSISISNMTNGTINGQDITLNGGISITSGDENKPCGTVTIGSDGVTNKVTIDGGTASDGMFVRQGHVKITADTIDISTEAEGNYGAVWVQNNTDTSEAPSNAASVTLTAENINIQSNSIGMVAFSNGQLNIKGNLTASAAAKLLSVRGNSTVNINTDGMHTTKLDGDINFNITNDGHSGLISNAYVNINLNGADSYFNGNIIKTYATNQGDDPSIGLANMTVENMNLAISNGAQWNPVYVDEFAEDQAASGTPVGAQEMLAVDNLTSNGGIINLENMRDQTLEIENVIGDNLTVNVASAENKLSITESKAENTALTVAASGNYAEQLVQNNVNESLQNLANQVVDSTGENEKSAATDLYVAETAVAGAITAEVGEDGNLLANTVKEGVNTTNEAISNMANIALMAWRAENNDMNKRLGELRDSKGEHGIWARMVRGEGTYESIKNQYNTYQLGYDEKLSTNPNWTVGAALSYTEGESSFNGGSGENKHTGFAVYGSYLNDDGSFIDLIAKYARLDHDFDVNGGAGSGDYDTNGYSVSAEYGKRFTQDNGMWIEPQVELTYGKIGSANYTTDNGVSVRQDGMDSLVGRVGFALGKDFKQGNAYVRASYLYDFDGETDMTFSKNGVIRGFEQDLGGGWWEVGVGTNINLSDATHLYMDVEKTYGGDIATPWQWNVGVRYSF